MKSLMWVLASLILLAACSNTDLAKTAEGSAASATLLSLEEYQQGNSYAFECNTTGFEPHTYAWDFGDGTQRTTIYKGVAHTYFKGGTYTVTCVASDDLINKTSEMTITAAVDEYDEYNPADDSIFDDLGVVDLLSDMDDEFLAYNTTANTSIRSERYERSSEDDEYDDEYDDALDFDFDDYDADSDPSNSTRPTAPNTTQNTTEGIGTTTNATVNTTTPPPNGTQNTTRINITLPDTAINTTPKIPDTAINTTPKIKITKNDTPVVGIPPMNETGNESDQEDREDDGRDESDGAIEGEETPEIDDESDGIVDVKLPYGRVKKMIIADLKSK